MATTMMKSPPIPIMPERKPVNTPARLMNLMIESA